MTNAIRTKALDPLETAWARAIVVFTSGTDFFYLTGCKIAIQTYLADEGGDNNAFVLERQIQ